jgi:hypothetical protein
MPYFPRPRNSQPRQPVGVNWSSPLSNGLVFLIDPYLGYDAVSGRRLTPSSGITKVGNEAYQGTAGTDSGAAFGGPDSLDFEAAPTNYTECTTLCFLYNPFASNYNATTGKIPSACGSRSTVTQGGFGFFLNYTAGTWYTQASAGSGIFNMGEALPLGLNVLTHTQSSNGVNYDHKFYRDGKLITTGTGDAPDYTATAFVINNAGPSQVFGASAQVFMACRFSRALPEPEILALSQNPWQLFDQEMLFFLPSVAAPQDLAQSALFQNSNSFYAHTLAALAALVQAELFQNSNSFFAHDIRAFKPGYPFDRSIDYAPGPVPKDFGQLQQFLEIELYKIKDAVDLLAAGHLDKTYVEPTRPREGDLVYADGTTWNPGSGLGIYQYRAAAWVFIG